MIPVYPNYYYDGMMNDWIFNVELNVLEVTGFSSLERAKRTMKTERLRLEKERRERYKRLLSINHL